MLIPVNDAVIETSIEGEGIPTILLAGLGQHMKSLESLTPYLHQAGFKTITINLRGIGKSTGSLKDITLHDFSDDVAGIINDLDIAPIHVIGHAFGNRVARCLATDHPNLVKTITLLAAGGRIPPTPEVRETMLRMRDPDISEGELRELQIKSLLSPSTDPEILSYLPPRSPEVASAHSLASRSVSVDHWWDAGDAPLLVVQGLDDVVAPTGNGRLLRDAHGDRVELVEVPDAGHLLQLEKPKEIAGYIIRYLTDYERV